MRSYARGVATTRSAATASTPPTHFARMLTPAEVDGGRLIPLRAP